MEHYVISKYTFFLPLATIEITTWQDIPLIIITTITVIMIFLFQVFAPEYVCRVDTKFFKTQSAISYCMFICKYAAFSRRSNKATLQNCTFISLRSLGVSRFRYSAEFLLIFFLVDKEWGKYYLLHFCLTELEILLRKDSVTDTHNFELIYNVSTYSNYSF